MLSRLFPSVANFVYQGERVALWILGVVLLLKVVTGGAAVLIGQEAASAADGFPLAEYSPQAAQAVVALFGAIGVTQILVCALGIVVLVRYRALVPLFLLFLVLEFLARKGVAHFNPVARAPGSIGFWLNWVIFFALCIALALSLKSKGTSRR
jgi:purine-cytosine permease-like protein